MADHGPTSELRDGCAARPMNDAAERVRQPVRLPRLVPGWRGRAPRLGAFVGACRFVWNEVLDQQEQLYDAARMWGGRAPSPTFPTLANGITELHGSVPWLQTMPFMPVRYTLRYPARREGDERPPRGTVVRLYVYLYDDVAIEVGVANDNHDEPLAIHPAARDLSPAWTTPTGEPLNHWLTALLPENGRREAWTVAASAARLEAGLTPEPRNAAEILWGNTEAEYPGAVSFAREARAPTWSNAYATLTDEEIGTRLLEAAVTAVGARRGRPTTNDDLRSPACAARSASHSSRTTAGAPRATTRSTAGSRNASSITGSLARRESKRSVSVAAPWSEYLAA